MVRRLVVALMVVVVMAATVVVGPTVALGPGGGTSSVASASAQLPGQPVCGPWQLAWYVSRGGYWYFFWWRWCWNPSLQNPWYIDWAGWGWGPWAGPGWGPGYQYSTSS
jgi:hypothetical protein